MTDLDSERFLHRAYLFRRLGRALEHDLRAPLNSVVLATEVISRQASARVEEESVALLKRSLDEFRERIESYLAEARFDLEETPSALTLGAVIERAITLLTPMARAHGVQLDHEPLGAGEPSVDRPSEWKDPVLARVLHAIDDAGRGGGVEVRGLLENERAGLRITVRRGEGHRDEEPPELRRRSDALTRDLVEGLGGELRTDGEHEVEIFTAAHGRS